ncbi:Carbohydrate-binding WSC [Niveomyces insectorum RCEF 264]|uniref:Carbohydrate-binding WSC n=1 Tax=Niveomyces insectorum RCEF 264 TaxID=1081102 RepID=A0A167PUC9_9HYPO|nr:Carbohydrate-binding WSC [Niveomyces insectorum RCEF 264]
MASLLQAGLSGLLFSFNLLGRVRGNPDMDYCASINTASTPTNSSIYQSDGLCFNFCLNQYAYAVIQENHCWCSDYTPDESKQASTSECSFQCPGFPNDTCGGDGLYGYMTLNKKPSGTLDLSPSATGHSSRTLHPLSVVFLPAASKLHDDNDVLELNRIVILILLFADITKQYLTVAPSVEATAPVVTSHHKGLSTGAAVGIAVAVVVVAIVAAIIAFLVWRRKRKNPDSGDALFASTNQKTPSPRGGSPNATGSPKVSEASTVPTFARRLVDGQWESDQSGRRRSALMPIDPRIDPGFSGIYARTDNKSHDSVNSLRDEHDYSRRVHQPAKVLRATNPDPDVE